MASTKGLRVIIAGGGTGGHFFPGLAVAQALVSGAPPTRVLFVGGRRGIEAKLAPESGFPFKSVPASGFAGVSLSKRLKAAFSVPAALLACVAILIGFRPSVVVGVGGYASFPMALAAGLAGIPVILLEQNVSPGLANKLLAPLSAAVAVSFRQTLAAFRGKGYLLGNPVRAALSSVGPERPPETPFRLLIFGGSRGSRALNQAAAAALPALKDLPGGIEIYHQTGAEDLAWVQKAYAKNELTARVEPFISDMENAYAWCHAVLCRAGATTLAELAAVRRPALLVPFPLAAGAHQLANAKGLQALGAALCLEQKDLTSDSLLSALQELADKEVRAKMAKALSAAAKPGAAEDIARLVRLAGGLT